MKKLIIFNFWYAPVANDMSEMSNIWYFKNYEDYFDEVQFVSLIGDKRETIFNGRSSFVFLGRGNNIINLLSSPFRLYQHVKKEKPTHLMSSEQILLWWLSSLVKFFLRKKIYLLPLTYPEQVYKITGQSLTFKYPIWLDRILLKLSYKSCTAALTAKGAGNFSNWMNGNKILKKKLIIADALPDCVPFPSFMKTLEEFKDDFKVRIKENEPYILINIGRFVKEKLTDHLIKAASLLHKSNVALELILIGSGPERDNLVELIKKLDLEDQVKMIDYVSNGELPKYLRNADLFVSPFTGGAFREAAMCGLPIIAYDIDWLKGMMEHKKNFYAVSDIDYIKLADGIRELLDNANLRKELSVNIREFAETIWSPKNIQLSLKKIFD